MWLFTQEGFFSIVRKGADRHLVVRARCDADLDRLRQDWLPTLGPTVHGAGTDYPVRAYCEARDLGEALKAMLLDLDYPNFKDRIAKKLSKAHLAAAHKVWESMHLLEQESESPNAPPSGMQPGYGGVVVDKAGEKVLLREPRGHYGGYVWTFAKGRPTGRESATNCARREIREELGCEVTDLQPIEGWFAGDTTATQFYLCRWLSDAGEPEPSETAQVQWASWDEAVALIGLTRSQKGRKRDLAVLAAAKRMCLQRD